MKEGQRKRERKRIEKKRRQVYGPVLPELPHTVLSETLYYREREKIGLG